MAELARSGAKILSHIKKKTESHTSGQSLLAGRRERKK
jgi:hypothetical protein